MNEKQIKMKQMINVLAPGGWKCLEVATTFWKGSSLKKLKRQQMIIQHIF